MTKALTPGLVFQSVNPDGSTAAPASEVEVTFSELEGASDALLIGFMELAQWGVKFSHDEHGNIWVEFARLGFTTKADEKMPGDGLATVPSPKQLPEDQPSAVLGENRRVRVGSRRMLTSTEISSE